MAEVRLPLSIVYETTAPVSVPDVIAALQAANSISADAAALLPSFIDGLQVNKSSLNVHSLTEGSLREALFIALLVTFQSDLSGEVPPMIEDLFKITVSEKYDTIATVVFLVVLFYGAGLAVDMMRKSFSDSLPRAKLNELIDLLALETGKSAAEVRKIVEARFQKPAPAKRVVREAKRFFLPSQKDGNAPVSFDRDRVGSQTIAEIPYPGDSDRDKDFDRYDPYGAARLELHAQDRDRASTGWAAVLREVSDRRLKVRVIEPVQPSDLWGRDEVMADVVVVSKLTSDGYTPSEIQVTKVYPKDGVSPDQ